MTNEIADGSVKTPEENVIDWEARAKKAEAKIVDMKNSLEDKQPENKNEEVDLDKKISELLESKLAALTQKEEKEKQEEKYEANQDTTNSMSMSWGENIGWTWFKWVSLSDFDKMSPEQKRQYITESTNTNWEVIFI